MSGEPFVGRPSFLRTRWSNFCECSTIGILYIVSESTASNTESEGTLQKSPIFSRSSGPTVYCERQTITSGCMPILRSSLTLCCVGFVLSSPDAAM